MPILEKGSILRCQDFMVHRAVSSINHLMIKRIEPSQVLTFPFILVVLQFRANICDGY
ncbi:MAG: hypothetical protein HY097_05385 [Nitrospinae bacterium]|nr:hypothetical protein [Nitrospinota bacterium]